MRDINAIVRDDTVYFDHHYIMSLVYSGVPTAVAVLAYIWYSLRATVPWWQLAALSAPLLCISSVLTRYPKLFSTVVMLYTPLVCCLYVLAACDMLLGWGIMTLADRLAYADILIARLLGFCLFQLASPSSTGAFSCSVSNPLVACMAPCTEPFHVDLFPGETMAHVATVGTAVFYVHCAGTIAPLSLLPGTGHTLASWLTLLIMVATAAITLAQVMLETRTVRWRVPIVLLHALLMATCLSSGFAFAIYLYFALPVSRMAGADDDDGACRRKEE